MKEIISVLFSSILFITTTTSVVMFSINYWESYICTKYEEATGRETKWIFMDNCYINTGKEWLRKDEYAAVIIAREGLQSR